MKKKNDSVRKPVVGKERSNLKNAGNENEKTKKKKKKKKIPKDKIENEDKVEITEKKELVDNVKINTYNENDDKLVRKIISYMEQEKEEMVNNLLNKYYDADKKTPLFYIDMNIHQCIYGVFFPLSIKDKSLSNKTTNMYYENSCMYFYNVTNNKCLNTIFHFLKEFFKEHALHDFENCCEMMQSTYLFFFILLTDYFMVIPKVRHYCVENFKILFKLKTYLFEKYIKHTNKIILNKFILLNKAENGNKKNAFFFSETKIINGIKNENKIEFSNMTMSIISPNHVDKRYFLTLVVKNKSYEYMDDFIFLDLFKIHILSNPSVSASFGMDKMASSTNHACGDYSNSSPYVPLSDVANTFPMEEQQNAFSYIYEIELPTYIYTDEELEIFYIDTNKKVSCANFFPVDNLHHLGEGSHLHGTHAEMPNGEGAEVEKRQNETEEERTDNLDFQHMHNKENITTEDSTPKCTEEVNCAKENIRINIQNEKHVKACDMSKEKRENTLQECSKTKKPYDEINIVKVQSEKIALNNKTYVRIYSNRISNYYINLNSISNFPYIQWEIKYCENKVVAMIRNRNGKSFIFHIDEYGMELQDNGIDVLKDLYNCTLDVYTLLFLLKKKGINLLVTNVEVEKMLEKERYHMAEDQTEELLINDILLCFRFMAFYSGDVSLANGTKSKMMVSVKGPLTDSLNVEYEENFCRIAKIETEESEKKFIKNLTRHKSILYCLFELCEFINLNNKKEKTKLGDTTKQENNDDEKNDVVNFQNFLTNIFSRNSIEKMNEVVIKDEDNLKKNSLQVDDAETLSANDYKNLFELSPMVHNLHTFLRLTRAVSFTGV
ncbi:conserved Plasmodium protein, unknown function [Plasmodium knowlesi strain H]|uniref:Uncharacterized protein n=3 Tax=Plasmodium knowlesi TaxID=5850 RepID=A0A5K1VJ96_PLAKH|nr:conserved Plasmodium protein, unknown function [Plasmodium knowlesi strain H]OTN65656.1 Uncharacterized protein PKNOH_S110087700 [Plasmodium knowlesi]CAA9989498.1 conserved Plasmodium protein, unknown function [Plasmodium knowlesi strain H]SBO25177.1 conserved Plasmodium protein, unknown function [Plasmodium knowlesi strain H]SBO27774.1 conserved Plasmodium protein, unknown function [Plasmodium knowlesi strain H]VVS78972.1 conserved Plasmodium protein, unknown function [Plasmodium knowlesi |eukprot:XP_002260223.1 hypothetical protein, conserved in Plasmodium species [Plasmodium knowlesi strain H]